MSERETTFDNAKGGDRVYSNLFKYKNLGDKTNAVIVKIREDYRYRIEVRPDVDSRTFTFRTDGSYFENGGQALFWENPIKEIPVRLKRKVTKKGWIGIMQTIHDRLPGGIIAWGSDVFPTKEAFAAAYNIEKYQMKEIEFEVEE